jgi:hypothetical protein
MHCKIFFISTHLGFNIGRIPRRPHACEFNFPPFFSFIAKARDAGTGNKSVRE